MQEGIDPERCIEGDPAFILSVLDVTDTLLVMYLDIDLTFMSFGQMLDNVLSDNQCYPQMLVNDPSFALLNEDPYVLSQGVNNNNRLWLVPPTPQLINGRTPPNRERDIPYLGPDDYILEEHNTSRRLRRDEVDLLAETMPLDEQYRILEEQMHEVDAYVDCVGDDCATSIRLVSEYALPS